MKKKVATKARRKVPKPRAVLTIHGKVGMSRTEAHEIWSWLQSVVLSIYLEGAVERNVRLVLL